MLKIHNIKWEYGKFKYYTDFTSLLQSKMKEYNIKCSIDFIKDESGSILVFKDVAANQTIGTLIDNKIMLKPGDPRIKKLKKDHLLSKRPTKEQYHMFFKNIHNSLDELGLFADVFYTNEKSGMNLKLREGKEVYNIYPEIKSYPIKG